MGLFRRHRCSVCGSSFRRIEELMQHQQIVHGAQSRYECKSCKRSFANGEDLRTHAREFHSYKKK